MDVRPGQGSWLEPHREAALVLAAQRGETPAYFELMRAYQRPLWRVCLTLTRQRDEAEALLQDTARRAQRNLKQIPAGQPFFPWLVRLTRSLAVAQARRRAGEPAFLTSVKRPNGESWDTGAAGAYHMAYEQRVLFAFADLSVDEQLLLGLRLFERLPYGEIAATVELPLTATMHRIATLRERIELAARAGGKAA